MGIAKLSVGQDSSPARVLQDPLFERPAWAPAAGLESCPTKQFTRVIQCYPA
jgi:hypothetical protein